MTTIAVAAFSARSLVEAARADGFDVIALDLFGDADTRRAANDWRAIGDASSLRIDPARTLAALRDIAARGDVAGWVAGSGFDSMPFLLAHGARLLPLFGTPVPAVRRLRDAATFFTALQVLGIGHPDVSLQRPADPTGWLCKDMGGSGGWHIREAAGMPDALAPGGTALYFQRFATGHAMSATFIADGSRAQVIGCNEMTVRPMGPRPFVYAGAIGPVPVSPAVAAQVERAVQKLTAEFALRGLASLDFMCDGDAVRVLEVNARPPGSLDLYQGCVPGGWMAAHIAACREGRLPADVQTPGEVRGVEIVFASGPLQLDAAASAALSQTPDTHDVPEPNSRFDADAPVCTLSARGATPGQVRATLDARRAALQAHWAAAPSQPQETPA